MGTTVEVRRQSRLRTLYWWTLLLVTLVVVDDLTTGWIFWSLGALVHPAFSAIIAFVLYWAGGYWLAYRGLQPEPGKVASAVLSRLQLERKNPEIEAREQQLWSKVTSVAVAVPMSILFGGVLVSLWLRRRGVVNQKQAYRLAFWLCGLYALEYALIHGLGLGSAGYSLFH